MLRTGNGSLVVLAEAMGEVHLYFDEFMVIILRDCFYVPNFKRNLISVACLFKDSYYVSFNKKGSYLQKQISYLEWMDGK